MKSFFQAAIVIGFVLNNNLSRAIESNGSLRGKRGPKTLFTEQNHKRSFGPRIIGGSEATPGRYKHYVSLYDSLFGHFCGGSLLTPDTVISAAHCGGDYYQVVIDTHDLNTISEEDRFDIAKEVIHPRYADSENDFMLLFLTEPATSRNHTVEYIKLNSDATVPNAGDPITVIGHGITDQSDYEVSPVLMEVEVVALSNEECKENSYDSLTDDMLCAADTSKDSCQGDSGGPLFIRGNHSSGALDVQVGIVSWGYGCADEQYPGVYARISEGYEWIRREVCTNSAFAPEDFDCANLTPTTAPPTVAPMICPFQYDESKIDYEAGDQIEFGYGVYECLGGCFTQYCNTPFFSSNWDLTAQTLWLNSWVKVGDCNSKPESSNNNPTSAPSRFSIPATSTPAPSDSTPAPSPSPSDSDKVIRVADGCIRSEKNEVQVDMCLATNHTSPVSVNCCTGSINGGDLECNRRGCFATANFESAKSYCEDKNMRLCSREELETEVCCLLGCGFDRNITWTSDTDCSEPI